jgi:hypothetical protein
MNGPAGAGSQFTRPGGSEYRRILGETEGRPTTICGQNRQREQASRARQHGTTTDWLDYRRDQKCDRSTFRHHRFTQYVPEYHSIEHQSNVAPLNSGRR